MPAVYLDASYVSACVTDRTDGKSVYRHDESREWWDTQAGRHELFIRQEVLNERSDPAFRRSAEALRWVDAVPLLDIDEEVIGVAELLVRERVMPGPVAGDCIHVAAAAVHGCEYPLSWNVRHLANPNKVRHLQVVCRRVGLVPPTIVTPDLLWDWGRIMAQSQAHTLAKCPTAAAPDPLIDEIRAIKRSVSERFGNDVRKLGAHLMREQEKNRHRLVSRKASERVG